MSEPIPVLYAGTNQKSAGSITADLEREFPNLSVRSVTQAEEAYGVLDDDAVECLVCGDALADADGLEFLERVADDYPDVPRLFVSDRDSEELARTAFASGADDYVSKTVSAPALLLGNKIRQIATSRRTERALRRQEAHHQALTESAADTIVTIDDASTITFVNEAAEEMFGYSTEELVGSSLTTLMSDENARSHRESIERYLRTGERHLDWDYLELPGRHRDGHEVSLGVSFGEFRHEGEHFFTGIVRDITERKQLEGQLRRERNLKDRIVETSPVGITIVESDGEFSFANERAEEILGLSEEAMTDLRYNAAEFDIVDRDGDPLAEEELPFRQVVDTGETVLDVEIGVRRPDGKRVWLSINGAALRRENGSVVEAVFAFTDITERVQLETERREILGRVTDAFFALDDEWHFTYLNERAHELINPEGEDLLGRELWEEFPETVDSPFEERYRHAMAHQESVTFEEFYPPLDTWFEVSAYPSETGLSVYFRDITDRKRREEQLTSLNELGRALTNAETEREASEIVVEAARETVDLPLVTIELYDEDSGRLRAGPRTSAVTDLVGDGPLFESDRGTPWEVFVTNEAVVEGDVTAETPLRSAIVLPLGEHGVFIGGSTDPHAISDTDVELAHILVANTISAFDRVDREQELREQKTELEEQTRTLERVNRINEVIRGIVQELIQASTREEVMQAVCDRLAGTGSYYFAWIGSYDTITDEIVPEAWAGAEDGFLEQIPLSTVDDPSDRDPTRRVVHAREAYVQNSLASNPPFEPWRQAALERGYQSTIAVPIVYQNNLYGVLNLYSKRSDVFNRMEETVLTELGEMISYVLNALERKEALVSDKSVEVEFRVQDLSDSWLGFVAEQACEFTFENMVQRSDGLLHVFFSVEGVPPEDVLRFGEDSPQINSITLISERASLFECTLAESSFLSTLLDRGGVLQSISANEEGGHIIVRTPQSAEIRTFAELFEDQYADATLVARREIDEPIQTKQEFEAEFRDQLTERQEEVLQTAYAAGFFEDPRESTAQQIGEILGVSQPTVSRHIRSGERTLFSLLFD